MNVVACAAPVGSLEPAPLTSLPLGLDGVETQIDAFWASDDAYLVRVSGGNLASWFRIDAELTPDAVTDDAERARAAAMLSDITPIGGGRVAFPIGSTGRTVFRVWRGGGCDRTGRTRIRGVRVARSRRRPA